MVVGKKTSKSKKCKPQSSSQQHHQQHLQASSSSADCLKDDAPLSSSAGVSRELHENAIELGYNSGDEYDRANVLNFSAKQIDEIEKHFEKKMRKKGFIIKKMAEDGACLFRAVADQIYGDQEMHQALRKLCMDYMAKNSDYFSHYVTEDFNDYVKRKRSNNCHGNHVEIQAMSEMFNRPIEVYHYNCEPINIFQGCNQADSEPIRLSYHQNVHYNSVVDPYKATVGVGLGFPSFKPGLAEKNLLEKAMRISEDHELEKVMLEDKMKMTDWEATNEAIEEQIARESYVEWLKDNERKVSKSKKVKFTATATATTTSNNLSSNGSPKWSDEKQKSPKLSPRLSPKAGSSGLNSHNYNSYGNFVETGTFVNQFPPPMFGDCVSEWDDNDILRQVLAQSQQEYLDSLKRKAKESYSECSNDKASSSGLNEYYHEAFSEGCSSGLSGSPNKKLKVNNTSPERSTKLDEQQQQVSETADKTRGETDKARGETDKAANDNDEKLTRHEVSSQSGEELKCDKIEEVACEQSIKSDESSEAATSSTISPDESSKQ